MDSKSLSSKERMLTVLNFQEPDYVPCCFMIFRALRDKCKDEMEFIERQLELGLDARVNLPEFVPNFHPDVIIKEWKEFPTGENQPLLHREYQTPSGKLTAIVKQVEDWPFKDHLPLFDDYVTPRTKKFLITEESDLEKFKYLLLSPSKWDIQKFREVSKNLKKYSSDKGLIFCGGWNSWTDKEGYLTYGSDYGTMGIDALMWICGAIEPLYWAYDKPDFLKEIIEMIANWNRKRMEIYLDEGIELIIKRAWYENTEFWSPQLFKKFIYPVLKKDIEITHQAGAKFGYIMTSAIMPLLDDFVELGIDVIIGIDPVQGKGTDLKKLKEKVNNKICLWGGISGALTIEQGTEKEVKDAVEYALNVFVGGSGFILSPVDNVREDTETSWHNVNVLINSWKELRNKCK